MFIKILDFVSISLFLLLFSKLTKTLEFLYFESSGKKSVVTESNIGTLFASDHIHCASTCLLTKLCVAATFDTELKSCTMFESVQEFEPIDNNQMITLVQMGSCPFRDTHIGTSRK